MNNKIMNNSRRDRRTCLEVKPRVTFRVTADQARQIEGHMQKYPLSLSEIVRTAVDRGLDGIDDDLEKQAQVDKRYLQFTGDRKLHYAQPG